MSFQVLHMAEGGSADAIEAGREAIQDDQVLYAHSVAITCAAWSRPHRKLITGDAAGNIIVWAQKDASGMWKEEMASKRQASPVLHKQYVSV